MQLPLSLLLTLENLINPLLRQMASQGSSSSLALERLDGKQLHFQVSGSQLGLSLNFYAAELRLERGHKTSADAWVEAPLSAYAKLLTSSNSSSLFASLGVQVGGQTGLLEALQDLISSLGDDLQEAINQALSQTPLNQLPLSPSLTGLKSQLHNTFGWLSSLGSNALLDAQNYLDDETSRLVGRNHWHLLQEASQQTQLELDRLAARIDLIRHKLQPKEP